MSKRIYQLVKLRIQTVKDLKRLANDMGMGSLEDLIRMMIQLTETHRLQLKEQGWNKGFKG